MKKALAGRFLFSLLLIILVSCGNVKSTSVPHGSSITISPASFSITDISATAASHTKFFTITVLDEAGLPLNKVKLNIQFPFAVPDPSGAVQLYSGDTPVNSPVDVSTDAFGVFNLRLDYQSGGGLAYTGSLEVRSGTAFQSATITIN